MSRGRPSTRFANPVREQGVRKAARPVAALEPCGRGCAGPEYSYAVAVELEHHLGAWPEAELVPHWLRDDDLALRTHALSHTNSITIAAQSAEVRRTHSTRRDSDPSVLDDLLAEPVPKLTSRTLTTPAALRNELEAVRDKGYSRERDEAVLGESSVAARIFDHSGHVVGAIGVVGDTERILPRGPAKGLTAAVVEAARGVSRELGARRWPAGSAP